MIKLNWSLKALTLVSALLLSLSACGNDNSGAQTSAKQASSEQATEAEQAIAKQVEKKLLDAIGELPSAVMPAPMPGYQMAVTSQGNFFVSNDGGYMIYGRVFDIRDGMKEVTNVGLNPMRAAKLEELKQDAIVFPAKGAEKHKVYVFTDITCGYCRKMHRQIEEYQAAGISVHYLAYPRSKANAESMQKIWCADDPAQAMTNAKLKDEVVTAQCSDQTETVMDQYEAGVSFGIRGTPATVLVDGTLMPGYRSPEDMLKLLESAQ